MEKFIKLMDSHNCAIVINSDHISYVHRNCNETLTKVRVAGDTEESTIFVKEPVEEIYALLTGDKRYFAEKAREAKRLEKQQKSNVVVEDGCTPVVDLPTQPYGGIVSSTPCVTSENVTCAGGVIVISGGNYSIDSSALSAVTSSDVVTSGAVIFKDNGTTDTSDTIISVSAGK